MTVGREPAVTSDPENSETGKPWRNLGQCKEDFFYQGVLFKFKTKDTYGHNSIDDYQYALGMKMDGSTELCFVGIDGGSWGYGRCQLPPASLFEGNKYTLSSKWVFDNFENISGVIDKGDIWYCKKFDPAPTR